MVPLRGTVVYWHSSPQASLRSTWGLRHVASPTLSAAIAEASLLSPVPQASLLSPVPQASLRSTWGWRQVASPTLSARLPVPQASLRSTRGWRQVASPTLFSLFAWGLQLHYGDAGASHAHVFVAEGADAGHGGEVLADVLA